MKPTVLLISFFLILPACSKHCETPEEAAIALLDIHNLRGKMPEERTSDAKNKAVEESRILALVADWDPEDRFISDLYLGVVLGALARHQGNLKSETRGHTATISTGDNKVHFVRIQNTWKVHLEKTIPEDMKRRAAQEKERYEAARAAGQAAELR